MNDHTNRATRLRYTATGALAALAATGAIAGPTVLAATPRAKSSGNAVPAACPSKIGRAAEAKSGPGAPVKPGGPQDAASNPFVAAVHRLVDHGTITAAQGQALDRQILTGRIDSGTFGSIGLNQTQIQAVQQTLTSTKRALAGSGG